jgi:pyruvate/2-oxoglutarate dehydrogenase complex dihydrolipoamide acyltransferase (E2) component
MPFWYQVPIPTLDDPQPTSVHLVRWLVDVGAEVHRGTKIAIIEAPTGRYVVMTNGDGRLRERHFPAGAEIELMTPIAVITADGESIPYGRPVSLAERVDESA